MTSGLRSMASHGPVGVPRAAVNSSKAFFCSAVIFSAGIGGMRFWAPASIAAAKMVAKITTTIVVSDANALIFSPVEN
jgi:hypothetical protein